MLSLHGRDVSARPVDAPARGEIRDAWIRIRGRLGPSPLVPSSLGLLKVETLQPTGSFKLRGALAALTRLEPGARVVTASAGNHGLGVAHAAALLGLDAAIVVPATASSAKLAALERYPARLVRVGDDYDAAERHALDLAASEERRYVSPYNDPDVIAGQGSIAIEVLRDLEGPLTIVCPLGGGGLASGVGLWASAHERVRVVAVEGAGAPAMSAALAAGRIVPVPLHPTLADGLGGNLEGGSVTFELVRSHVHEVTVVHEDELAAAMRFLAREHGLVVEAAGAAAVAALLAGRVHSHHGRVVAVVTGRNVEPATHARVVASD
jgi:threonine dehydratase